MRLEREILDGLNRLASAPNSFSPLPRKAAAPGARPTAHQDTIIASLRGRIATFGRCPDDLSAEGALAELLAARCQYELEPRNLVTFDPARLKVARGETVPRNLEGLLRPEVAGYVKHFGQCIELSGGLDGEFAGGLLPTP